MKTVVLEEPNLSFSSLVSESWRAWVMAGDAQ